MKIYPTHLIRSMIIYCYIPSTHLYIPKKSIIFQHLSLVQIKYNKKFSIKHEDWRSLWLLIDGWRRRCSGINLLLHKRTINQTKPQLFSSAPRPSYWPNLPGKSRQTTPNRHDHRVDHHALMPSLIQRRSVLLGHRLRYDWEKTCQIQGGL